MVSARCCAARSRAAARQASREALLPGAAERITVSYPWIRGEAYDELLTSTGATVGYYPPVATGPVRGRAGLRLWWVGALT